MTSTEFTYRHACQVLAEHHQSLREHPQHVPDADGRRDIVAAQDYLDTYMARTHPTATHLPDAAGTGCATGPPGPRW